MRNTHPLQFNMETFLFVAGYIINTGMIIAPCIGYITQSIKFKRKRTSNGFSLYLCLILSISSILRINFWFLKRFTPVLLCQSFTVIISLIYLMKVYLNYSDYNQTSTDKLEKLTTKSEHPIRDYIINLFCDLVDLKRFWKWNYLTPFLIYILLFFIVIMNITFFIGKHYTNYIEGIGYVALGIEVLPSIPQIITNFQTKSVETISVIMILLWLCGDSFKTGYYFVMKCPIQFICCSCTQITINIILIGQIIFYNKAGICLWASSFKEEDINQNDNDDNVNLYRKTANNRSYDTISFDMSKNRTNDDTLSLHASEFGD